MRENIKYIRGILRISMGWIFFWAFIDKLFGLGFATTTKKAWLNEGSPTTGFLEHASTGPLKVMFQSLAGQAWVDWAFMLGLLLIGLALILGIAMKLAAIGGVLMMLLMYLALLLPSNNPFMDDHIIYALVLIGLYLNGAGNDWGLGRKWSQSSLVQKYPCLK
ncbi:MAG: DoxX family membrane protein [Candidatus Komeilibacteria bacterium]|jgi:thiosulfate dehydrogenase (quinone) large subunit|nr:DoxX family membrane protein [Candidatus Komeilibacteria bacterium]MBT4447401.1 DoxX family membrane protein [Candidatus Komeilibacteria bacterium]